MNYRKIIENEIPGNAIAVDASVAAPCDSRYPKISLVCDNQECPEREVVTSSKYKKPPKISTRRLCPNCLKPLRFQSYLEEFYIEPVSVVV